MSRRATTEIDKALRAALNSARSPEGKRRFPSRDTVQQVTRRRPQGLGLVQPGCPHVACTMIGKHRRRSSNRDASLHTENRPTGFTRVDTHFRTTGIKVGSLHLVAARFLRKPAWPRGMRQPGPSVLFRVQVAPRKFRGGYKGHNYGHSRQNNKSHLSPDGLYIIDLFGAERGT